MDNFNGPADQEERERLGRRYSVEGGPGPLDGPLQMPTAWQMDREKLEKYQKIERELGKVDETVMDVEKHIIERMKAEGGASNLKLLAEALEIVRKLERRSYI